MIDSDNKKILISHRGNIDGPNPERENSVDYIQEALDKGYHVEIDVWYKDGWFLGHDYPQYDNLPEYFLNNPKFFLHAKNSEAFRIMMSVGRYIQSDMFWHNTDDYVFTQKGNIWVYPNKPLFKDVICVLPELGINGNIKECYGICSDYIKDYE